MNGTSHNRERRVEVDGITWFVNSCANCPLLIKKRKGRGNGAYAWCPRLELEILNTRVVRANCPLDPR